MSRIATALMISIILCSAALAEEQSPPQVVQAADGTAVMLPTRQSIVGTQLQVDYKPPVFCRWTNPDDHVQWSCRVEKPGTYMLKMTYSCQPSTANTPFEVQLGKTTVKSTTVATKDWQDYQTFTLAKVRIPRPIEMKVVVRPTAKPVRALMDLRSVTLEPVAETPMASR